MSEISDATQLTGSQKAAILLTVLGDDAAASIFRNLPEDDLQTIAREISNLGLVPAHISQQVIREYRQMTKAREYLAEGGQATATRLLVKAFGENGAKNLQHQMVRVGEIDGGKTEALQRADPKQLGRRVDHTSSTCQSRRIGAAPGQPAAVFPGDRRAHRVLRVPPPAFRG